MGESNSIFNSINYKCDVVLTLLKVSRQCQKARHLSFARRHIRCAGSIKIEWTVSPRWLLWSGEPSRTVRLSVGGYFLLTGLSSPLGPQAPPRRRRLRRRRLWLRHPFWILLSAESRYDDDITSCEIIFVVSLIWFVCTVTIFGWCYSLHSSFAGLLSLIVLRVNYVIIA